MRVFHIISHFSLGGAERVALNICKSSNDNIEYHIVEVASVKSKFSERMIYEMKKNGIQYHRSPISSVKLAIIFFPLWFLGIYLKYRPQIIHTHTEVPDLSIYLWHFLYPWHKCFIRTIHNTELWNDWKFIGKKVEKFFQYHKSNIAISQSTQQLYVDEYGGPFPPIIYNGLEVQRQQLFPELKIGKKNILFAGRFEFQKGIDQLIEVVTALQDDQRFFFHIVGEGSLKKKLNELIAKCSNVTLYTQVYGLANYLGSFDYLFMPSNFEGLPLLSIEASLAKTPTISSDCKGLHETLPEDWDLKVTSNDSKGYVQLFKLLDDSLYELRAEKVYNFASERFSLVKMQKAYEEVYNDYFLKVTNN